MQSTVSRSRISGGEGEATPRPDSSSNILRKLQGDHVKMFGARVDNSAITDNATLGVFDGHLPRKIRVSDSSVSDNAFLNGFVTVENSTIKGNARVTYAKVYDSNLGGSVVVDGESSDPEDNSSIRGVTLSEGYIGSYADIRGPQDVSQVRKHGRVYTRYRTGGGLFRTDYQYTFQEFDLAREKPIYGYVYQGSDLYREVKDLF
jgi:hypothetical protein